MMGPLAYIVGKGRLARHIVKLFHKSPSRVKVLNDLNGEVVTTLRVCREHPQQFTRVLRYLVPSRSLFGQFAAQDSPATLTDIQQAARLFYLQKNAFSGLVQHRAYHYAVPAPAHFSPERPPAKFETTAERLRHVQLESSRTTVTLVLRFVGLAIFPYTFDGSTVSIRDARYSAVITPTALAAASRYVLRLRIETNASRVILVVHTRRPSPGTVSLVHATESALVRAAVPFAVESVDRLRSQATKVVDLRLAWELIKILRRRQITPR